MTAGEEHSLWEYPFPEKRGVKFKLVLDDVKAEAARTH